MSTSNKIKTAVILFTIGLLLSFGFMSSAQPADNAIVLTEENHIYFNDKVTDETVAKAQLSLYKISENSSKNSVIYLVIDSPGGSISAGNRFIDFANSLPQKIKTICLFCASMGYHMFQSFDERLVYESSELMSHRAALGGLSGQIPGELNSRLNNIMAVVNNMDAKVAKRIGTSVEAYQKSIHDELWIDGLTAVKTKHADRVAKIRCNDKLLNGKREQRFATFIGEVSVTFSTCPLISGFLDVKLGRGNGFRSFNEAKSVVKGIQRKAVFTY